MSKPLFSRLIKCKNCNRNFKSKKDGRKRFYICSTYDNYGKGKCERNQIDQDYLVELLERRFDKILTYEEIREEVEQIEVNGDELIIYLNNQHPIELKKDIHIY